MADEHTPTTSEFRSVWAAWAEYGGLTSIRAALAGHPTCDVRPDGDYPSCAWKRAVADVRAALDA